MPTIAQRIADIHRKIAALVASQPEQNAAVRLVAVSKKKPIEDIIAAYHAGQRDFAENYCQEGIEKIQNIHESDIIWHFIGPIQSNKTADIAAHFDWVQSLDRLKIAERLNRQRPDEKQPLQVLIQVNASHEPQKSGVALSDINSFADAIAQFGRLQLRGLMTIGHASDPTINQKAFHTLKQAYNTLKLTHPQIDTLSMGMSQDMALAIQEGANMLRVGTAIFGLRIADAK